MRLRDGSVAVSASGTTNLRQVVPASNIWTVEVEEEAQLDATAAALRQQSGTSSP